MSDEKNQTLLKVRDKKNQTLLKASDRKNQTLLKARDKKTICGFIAHFPSTTDTLKRNIKRPHGLAKVVQNQSQEK